jgi:hypothetical protein
MKITWEFREFQGIVKYTVPGTPADARFLLDGNRGPQSIVNRSYYAMFYAALALMQNIGKTRRLIPHADGIKIMIEII